MPACIYVHSLYHSMCGVFMVIPCSQREEADNGVWCDNSLHPLHLLCHPLPTTGLCARPGQFMSLLQYTLACIPHHFSCNTCMYLYMYIRVCAPILILLDLFIHAFVQIFWGYTFRVTNCDSVLKLHTYCSSRIFYT